MKFTAIFALVASASAIQISSDADPEGQPATWNNHMIGTHFLIHAKDKIEELLKEAKTVEHETNSDKIGEIKGEIKRLRGHLDILLEASPQFKNDKTANAQEDSSSTEEAQQE